MQEIVIIGGGIVGATAAYYLVQNPHYHVTLIDEGTGCATRAAAGIICPWLSQRRNKKWYALTSQGAQFYPDFIAQLTQDSKAHAPYQQTGTLVFKDTPQKLEKLYQLAQTRKATTPRLGDLKIYQNEELPALIPNLTSKDGAVFTSGGGRLDGQLLLDQLRTLFESRGGRWLEGQAQLIDAHHISVNSQDFKADQIILAAGAWVPQLLQPLGYEVDIRPQKGQLLEVTLPQDTTEWPGCMLHGEIDILPFDQGRLVIGATHENDQGFNLEIDAEKIQAMKNQAASYIPDIDQVENHHVRVGTRAYTNDFCPFYGQLPDQPHIYLASGLGSSGLTSGPFIGWQLAQMLQQLPTHFDAEPYQVQPYLKPIHSK